MIVYDIILWDEKDPTTIEHYDLGKSWSENFIEFENGKIVPVDNSVIVRNGFENESGRFFEGDVVEYDNRDGYGVIIYDSEDAAFHIEPIDAKWIDAFASHRRWHRVKVIGNTYEMLDKSDK